MNHKKRIAIYLLLLFGLFLLTMAVPRVLHTVTGKIVQKAAKQLERDTEAIAVPDKRNQNANRAHRKESAG